MVRSIADIPAIPQLLAFDRALPVMTASRLMARHASYMTKYTFKAYHVHVMRTDRQTYTCIQSVHPHSYNVRCAIIEHDLVEHSTMQFH